MYVINQRAAGSVRLTLFSVLWCWSVTALSVQVDIAPELERLAAEHRFEVVGGEYLEDAVGRAEGDDIYRRLRLLLERFDHIIVQGPHGGIERVIVLGRTTPGAVPPPPIVDVGGSSTGDDPKNIVLETRREGNQHSVTVSLEGARGERIEKLLLIDTGADAIVLPASLIQPLGIAADRLSEREVQTANGRVKARMGSLPGVWLGTQRIADVEVAFLDDSQLGESALLGMSILGRYQMTIDDDSNTLTLKLP